MTAMTKILLGLVGAVFSVTLAVLVGLGLMSAEPLVGLLGVVTGTLISKFSHSQLAREERRHQLRLAALDRRLQAHQDAFSLWRQLLANMSDRNRIGQVVANC